MKGFTKIILIIIVSALLVAGIIFLSSKRSKEEPEKLILPPSPSEAVSPREKEENMKLTSPAFANNQLIPQKYTCDGQDISPPLAISEVPEGAQSLVLIVDDPDAPMGTWDHWVVWNINPSTTSIEEGGVPDGTVQGMNSFGKQPYGGPCPPSGTHHYYFKLYALDTKLELDTSSNKKAVEGAMEGHILDRAELVGLYQRQ